MIVLRIHDVNDKILRDLWTSLRPGKVLDISLASVFSISQE